MYDDDIYDDGYSDNVYECDGCYEDCPLDHECEYAEQCKANNEELE